MDIGAKVILVAIIFIVIIVIIVTINIIVTIDIIVKVNIVFLAWQVGDRHVGWRRWTLSSIVSEETMEQCVLVNIDQFDPFTFQVLFNPNEDSRLPQ